MKRYFAVLLILIAGCKRASLPTADLNSPSQETRDAAAKILQAKANAPSKMRWFFFSYHIKTGESQASLIKLLRSYKLDPSWESWWVEGPTNHYEYRLDNYWCLNSEFTNNNKSLVRWELSPNWQAISIQPSTNFNGTWVNYYANGQKYSEGNFINGIRSGEFTYLHSDGSKERIINYNLGKYDGPWTLYSALGRTVIAGQFSNQVRVGIWTYYNADGSTNSVVDNSQKKTN